MSDVPPWSGSGLILGIESSCDETAAAVVRYGRETLSSVVASQIDLHASYGGVVPELASREHLRNIVPVVRAAVAKAGIRLEDLDAVAVTAGPGLAGALLVGITYAKALAFGLSKPLLAINHLEGHIYAVLMHHASELIRETDHAPLLALIVSGGHSHLYLAYPPASGEASSWRYRNVGQTVDDAAGEAFDKVAKLLGVGYPGGPWIDALAPHGDAGAVPFSFSQIKRRGAGPGAEPRFDLSFSGIKTAVLRYTQSHAMQPAIEVRRPLLQYLKPTPEIVAGVIASGTLDRQTLDLLASFQHAVVGSLLKQTFAAASRFGARSILVSGGVAANSELRRRFSAKSRELGLAIAFPTRALSTDNAAMIAAAGWSKLVLEEFAVDSLTATPQLRLDEPPGRVDRSARIERK